MRPEGTSTLDDPQLFIVEQFAIHARFMPDKDAVVCADVRRTWAQFDANISRVANALIRDGLTRGSRVAVLMGNSVDMLEVLFGVVRAGACVVPLSGLLTGDQLDHLVADSGARMVVASAEFRQRLARCDAWPASSETLACIAFDPPAAGNGLATADADAGWLDGKTWLAGMPATAPGVRHQQTDEFNIIYSSGTTGLPKGIVQTHRARQHWAFSNAIEMGFSSESRALTTTALYSNGTWLMMLPVLFAGGTLVCQPSFSPAAFLSQVPDERITHTFMVPAQFMMVLAEPGFEAADLSSLQTVLCAGSPLRRDTKRAVLERLSSRLFELYGFSEGFATLLKPAQHAAKFDSVGTPVLGFDIRILDEQGRVLPPGEAGEIAGYGAGMMQGYHGQPEQTQALVWRAEDGRTFLRSGDIGKLDEDGFLYLVDRKKDMIISGGFNVFPRDIEEVVGRHPAVGDVTVIGIPDPKWGETPLALVIRQASADEKSGGGADALAAQIMSFANARLARHQRISGVVFRTEFPRNALGKVLKRILRDPYWAGD